jgi:mannose-6-phosphate isomerase-like protein (cupin superfamily)
LARDIIARGGNMPLQGLRIIPPSDRVPRETRFPGTRAETIANHLTPTNGFVVSVVSLDPGSKTRLHFHQVDTFEFVLSGSARVLDQHGNSQDITADTGIYYPAGRESAHSWECTGNIPVTFLFIYSAPPGQTDGLTPVE